MDNPIEQYIQDETDERLDKLLQEDKALQEAIRDNEDEFEIQFMEVLK